MDHGDIMDFTSKHPEVNRLRLVRPVYDLPESFGPNIRLQLAETANGLKYLHSMGIVHSDLKPVRAADSFSD